MTTILPASSAPEIAAACEIIREYAGSLGVDLCFQNLERELAGLPGEYAPPRGRFLLACVDEKVAGCVAVRPCSAEICEMKRLYVRPPYRGLGLGRQLATTAVAEARAIGYREMRLDSLPFMEDAVRLYVQMGFRPCAPYYDTPIAGTRFLSLALVPREN